jgi:hypothetical protein
MPAVTKSPQKMGASIEVIERMGVAEERNES